MSQPRRRSNNTSVCKFCRRRKVRCDKGNPCSACVKYGNSICEYPSEPGLRAVDKPEKNNYGESVLQLDLIRPLKRSKGSASSNSSVGSNGSLGLLGSSASSNHDSLMHSELEFLKKKISMLENSVSLSKHSSLSTHAEQKKQFHPIWYTEDPENFSFMLGVNPCVSESQYFSFHKSYLPFISMGSSAPRHYNPLSWVSLIKADSSLSQMFSFKHSQKHHTCYHNKVPNGPSERVFNDKFKKFLDEDSAYNESIETPSQQDESKQKLFLLLNQRAKSVGLTIYEGNLDAEHNLLKKVLMLLPSRKVIWLLIDRFFERVYPFFPFLDQMDFESIVTKILGSSSREDVEVKFLHIDKKIEVVYLGMILLVLRFAYLTLFTNKDSVNEANLYSNDPSPEAQELRYLLDNPIDIDVFGLAQRCATHFGYQRYLNIPILQLSLFLRLYNTYAPENGEGADDTNTHGYTAKIVDMAINLGLHREPDNFRSKIRSEKMNHLCRKIWWYLVTVDMNSGLSNGCHLLINKSQFDTRVPFHVPGAENCKDAKLEKAICVNYLRFEQQYDKLYNVVSMISDVRTPLLMKDFCERLSSLEKTVVEHLGTLTAETFELNFRQNREEELENACTLKIGFHAVFFLISINLHFFNHYEKMGEMDLAYYYLKKLLNVSVRRMLPFYDFYIEESSEIFKRTCDLAITPSFLTLVHKCTITLHCVMVRSRFSVLQYENLSTHQRDLLQNPEYAKRYNLLVQNCELGEACLKLFIKNVSCLTSRYYYSWRYVAAQKKLTSIRGGTDYYLQWCKGKECYQALTNDMLEDLNDIFKDAIQTTKKNKAEKAASFPPQGFGEDDFNQPMTVSTETSESIDAMTDQNQMLWQMLSMKPEINNASAYNRSPQYSGVDYFDPLNNIDLIYNLDTNLGGANVLDSLFDDMMNLSMPMEAGLPNN